MKCQILFSGINKKYFTMSSAKDFTQHAKLLSEDLVQPADQDSVVQSVVSLTSSLRVISLTVLADSIYNILNFFAEKM